METYTLRVAETDDHGAISADVLDEDGLVAETTRLSYGDYGVAVDRDGEGEHPEPTETAVTADVTTTDIQFSRREGAFEFRFLGDREPLASERISDEEWGLERTEE